MKKRIRSIFLVLALCLTLLPTTALAADPAPAAETADFTASDGGAAAIALLNQHKTGAENSAWDIGSNTLTLNGINFTTSAAIAVKLPAGTTLVLADGTSNTLTVGDAAAAESGTTNATLIYGIYAEGGLTIRSGAQGTGTLSVTSSAHSGSARTYSAALYAGGDLNIEGGTLTALGGDIFMDRHQPAAQQGNLTVSGGAAVIAKSIFGAERVTVTGAGIGCTELTADELTLNSGRVMVLKSVQEYNGTPYAAPALWLRKLTVNGGELNVSWVWNRITPIAFPADEYTGFPTPLVRMYGDDFAAVFNGGTTILNTGCAGNTALKVNTLSLAHGMVGTGYTGPQNEYDYLQADSAVPVRFSLPQITVSGITAKEKVYDGTAKAELDITRILFTGKVNNNDDKVALDLSGVNAAFENENVGENKHVTVTGQLKLKGPDAYKYTLTQPDLTGLTANITYATAQDTTLHAQTIRVGEGSSFRHPSFTGVGGEAVTGMVNPGSYTYEINADTHVYNIAADAIPTLLNRLSAGDTAHIRYTLVNSGNYKPPYTDGAVTVTMRARSDVSSYEVYVAESSNGTVTASPKNASKGDTVTLTVKPDSGYTLEALTVTDADGNVLALTDLGNGRHSFTMPAGRVEVKATFMEDNSLLNFFYDVPNSAYYYEAVKWAVEQGVTTGIGNDAFGPELPCTRAQIVTFLWRAAGSPESANAGSFSDVPSDGYYAKAVAWAIENGVTTGVGGDHFAPNDACTRAQAVTLLARALSARAEGKAAFSDVPADSYYAGAVAWAAASGITEGIGGGLFGPSNDCTRAQIVTFLYRAYSK